MTEQLARAIREEIKRRMRKEGKTLKWWIQKHFPDKNISTIQNQLQGKNRMKPEVKEVLLKYLLE